MRLDQIQKRKLITEGWNDSRLTLLETKVIIPFVQDIERYITEAQLTPDQINQLFTNVEQGATAAGGNRTLIGKGTDAAKFINTKMKELGQAVKKSGPVKNADAKFAELKAKIGAKDSKVVSAIQSVSDWAKENPGKASIAVAVLTVAASMAAGPMAGAIAGFISRASKDLLQGKDLSTAAGNAIKTAAIGAVAGAIADAVGGNIEVSKPDVEGGASEVSASVSSDDVTDAAGKESESVAQALSDMSPEEYKLEYAKSIAERYQNMNGGMSDAMIQKMADNITLQGDFPNNFKANFDGTVVRGNIYLTPDELKAWEGFVNPDDPFAPNGVLGKDTTQWLKDNVDGVKDQIDAQAAADAAADAELKAKYDAMSPEEQRAYDKKQASEPIYTSGFDDYTPPGEPKYKTESKKLSSLQIETIIEWCDATPAVMLTEGPLDVLKKGAGAVGGALKKGAAAVGAKAAKVGKNMTTKITADKLNSAWKKAGSPTDSDAIANILRQQGVSDEVLAPVYKQMGAKLPAAPAADAGTPGQTGGTTAKPAAGGTTAKPAAGGTTAKPAADAGTPGQTGGTTAKPAADAAAPMDFKGIQQAVAKLSQQDAKALVTHIDSLNKPTASTTKQPTAQATAAPNAKAAAPQGQEPADAKAAPAQTKNAAAGDTYEKAKGDIRKVQGGTKPMPPKTAAGIDADLAKLAKGDKESGVAAAQKIMNFAKAGVDVSKQQQAWIANSKAGERFLTQSEYFELSKMMREHELSWSDLGIRVHLLEGTNKMFGISLI